MTVQNIIDDVRRMVNDRGPVYRHTDGEMIVHTDAALKELFRKRPECLILDSMVAVPTSAPGTLTTVGATVPVPDRFRTDIAGFVVARLQPSAKG